MATSIMKVSDNWEVLTYRVRDKRIDPHHIKRLQVRLPDGTTCLYKAKAVDREVTVHDMGHQYQTTQTRLYAVVPFHGIEFMLDMYQHSNLVVDVLT